ncbi:1,3-beta-glucanosyltransferase [Globomyces sp. JEL0801]|nr:1,3-beta-glucanosyltransferase [Globomyces sp. JEL0801]
MIFQWGLLLWTFVRGDNTPTTIPIQRVLDKWHPNQKHKANIRYGKRHVSISRKQKISKELENYWNYVWLCQGNKQQLNLNLDTGSSDTWVRGWKCQSKDTSCIGTQLKRDNSLNATGLKWEISYGDKSSASGEIYITPVSIGNATSLIPVGIADNEFGMDDGVSDGILGLGNNPLSMISPVVQKSASYFDGLGYKGDMNRFAFYLSNAEDGDFGEVTIGGINERKFQGPIHYFPINHIGYWQFDISNMTFNVNGQKGQVPIAGQNNAISDTGTSFILLDSIIAKSINRLIGGTETEKDSGFYTVNCNVAQTGPLVDFIINDIVFSIPATVYVVARGDGLCYSGFAAKEDEETPVVLGDVFTRAYYTIYDKEHQRIGFASSVHQPVHYRR